MKKYLPAFVYLAGMIPLGMWQNSVRLALGDWGSFAAVIGYLLVLRLLGYLAVQAVETHHQMGIRKHNLAIESRRKKDVA